jgi:hypothetical protein
LSLKETLTQPEKKPAVVADCLALVDAEVASKSGVSGLAVKGGYKAVKGVKPGFIRNAVEKLLPEFADAIEPFWNGGGASHVVANREPVAEALLSVTDGKVAEAQGVVRSVYGKLRGSAKRHVEAAVPRLAELLEKHAG